MPARPQRRFLLLYVGLTVLVVLALNYFLVRPAEPRRVPYSEFWSLVEAGRVLEVEIRETEIVAKLSPAATSPTPTPPEATATANANANATATATAPAPAPASATELVAATRLPALDETKLLESLRAKGVAFSGRIEDAPWWQPLVFGWLLPIGLLSALYFLVMRRFRQGAGGALSFGKNRAKIYDASQTSPVTFDDVAGVDEAEDELREVVDFLKQPQKYRALGARIPKGVLLVGPPGTGKTLLAKAVAGEAAVPFFSMSGSEFVEMFVGVGASRVRDLFEQAKSRAPCIIFIDELDAIGKSRGGLAAMATHDEREQTLNQLLAEMDGFDTGAGVVIMAATNRPEVLDVALLRAGRFDRQVLVDRPDVGGREAILAIHARKVALAPDVQLRVVAQRTPGMVGADLANVVNEAALAAARRGSTSVAQADVEEAVDRMQLGLKKRGRVMNEEEKRRVAFHEAGHALVALSMRHADPVHRVTIIPRSIGALGATLQLPTEERYLVTRDQLRDGIAVMLGGRVAEELAFGDVSTGAQNDLERATETARQMVTRHGMSEKLGLPTWGRPLGARFLEGPFSFGDERNFSETTAAAIDAEVRAILDAEYARAREVLARRRGALDAVAARLLVDETLEREALAALAGDDGRDAPSALRAQREE